MKYICISNKGESHFHVTKGKIYNIIFDKYDMFLNGRIKRYLMYNDVPNKHYIWEDELELWFLPLNKIRERKLNRILK